METERLIIALINALMGLAVYSVKSQIASVKELLEAKNGDHDRRIAQLESDVRDLMRK